MTEHYVLNLIHEETGQPVQIVEAQLQQVCGPCGLRIHRGEWVLSAGGSGWAHLEHAERLIAKLEPLR